MPITLPNKNLGGKIQFKNNSNSGNLKLRVLAPFDLIDRIIQKFRSNVQSLRNPDFFIYFLDGDEYHIEEGGGTDMFDRGNYTAPALISGTDYTDLLSIPDPTPALNYASQSATLVDTNFLYASLGYSQALGSWPGGTQNEFYHPLTLIGARSGSGPIGFQKAGDNGSEGSGSILTGSLYTGSVINEFTTYAFYRQTYGAHECPAVCDLYVLFGHPKWKSHFGIVASGSNTDLDKQGGTLYADSSSQNVLAITTLLSKPHEMMEVTENEMRDIIQTYTVLIQDAISY